MNDRTRRRHRSGATPIPGTPPPFPRHSPLRAATRGPLRPRYFLSSPWAIGLAAILTGLSSSLTSGLCAAALPATAIPVGVTNALARDILQEIHPAGLVRADVLAFKSIEDDRPWRVDAALVVAEFKRGRWELWHVARRTPTTGQRTQWSEYTITDSTQRGSQSLNRRPTAADVRAFVKLSAWSFGPEPTFRLTRGELYPATWQSVLGFAPEYRFSAPTNPPPVSVPPPRKAK